MTALARPEGWQRGDWMQLYSGAAFYPADPQPDDIDPTDIAHALSLLCRYGGHVKRFYSVAEHCVLMSYAVSPEAALYALLHDATEAYVVDVPRPLKRLLPEYQEIEARVWEAIATHFGISPVAPDEVHDADFRICLNEREALMQNTSRAWHIEDLEPLDIDVQGWWPAYAEHRYLARLKELTR